MFHAIKKIYHHNKNLFDEYRHQDIILPRIGLSSRDLKKIKKHYLLKEGKVVFFDKIFQYNKGISFLHSVDEIFKSEIYKFSPDIESPLIIDCGANMGVSCIYFLKNYPKAKLIAFEPDEKIFNILQNNLNTYFHEADYSLFKKAVWTHETELEFFSEGGLAGSMIVDFEQNSNIVKIETIDLKKFLNQPVDFLKIDIEGAENQLIFDIQHLLPNVKNLFLEYHGIIGKKQNLGDILNLLTEEGFEYYIRLASDTINLPFCKENHRNFNQQLNIFCYRK